MYQSDFNAVPQNPTYVQTNEQWGQTVTSTDLLHTAYDILEDIAKRAVEGPHNLPQAEIQILAAFVLGFNSK